MNEFITPGQTASVEVTAHERYLKVREAENLLSTIQHHLSYAEHLAHFVNVEPLIDYINSLPKV